MSTDKQLRAFRTRLTHKALMAFDLLSAYWLAGVPVDEVPKRHGIPFKTVKTTFKLLDDILEL